MSTSNPAGDGNPFLACLKAKSGTSALGTFIMSGSPLITEAIGCCGFDWAIVDGEHSPIDTLDIAHLLQALGTTSTVPVVRVPWNDPVIVKRVLDAGAATVLFPFVQSADEARQAVRSMRYPPEGIRGMAGLTRASRFGAAPNHFRSANQRVTAVVQIETPTALERLEEIAAVDGVGALFIGPTDLSGSMGFYGDSTQPEVQRAVLDGPRRCHAVGKPIGTLAGTAEQAAKYREAGFDFVGISSDLGFLTGAARAALAGLRAGKAVAGGAAAGSGAAGTPGY